MSNTEVFGWKFSKFINNKNYDFKRDKILDVCGEDNVIDAYDLISSWENYKPTPLVKLGKPVSYTHLRAHET